MAEATSVMYVESIRGLPYMRRQDLAKELNICLKTVDNIVKEIEGEIKSGRYTDHAVISAGKIVLINTIVFFDYLTYRKCLSDKNTRKHTPPFNPAEIAAIMGWNNRIVRETA